MTQEKQNLAVKFNGMDELQFSEKREKKLEEGLVRLKKDIEQLERDINKAIGKTNKQNELNILLKCKKEEQQKLELKRPKILKDLQEKKNKGESCAPH